MCRVSLTLLECSNRFLRALQQPEQITGQASLFAKPNWSEAYKIRVRWIWHVSHLPLLGGEHCQRRTAAAYGLKWQQFIASLRKIIWYVYLFFRSNRPYYTLCYFITGLAWENQRFSYLRDSGKWSWSWRGCFSHLSSGILHQHRSEWVSETSSVSEEHFPGVWKILREHALSKVETVCNDKPTKIWYSPKQQRGFLSTVHV